MGLEAEAKAVSTPGVKQALRSIEEELEKLSIKEVSMDRAMTARANYMARDRPDFQYAVEELSRWTSTPIVLDRNQLKRFGKYHIDRPSIIT